MRPKRLASRLIQYPVQCSSDHDKHPVTCRQREHTQIQILRVAIFCRVALCSDGSSARGSRSHHRMSLASDLAPNHWNTSPQAGVMTNRKYLKGPSQKKTCSEYAL